MKKICLYLLSLLIVFTSCSSGGDEESLSIPSIDGGTIQITPTSSLTFEGAGGSEILTITSPGDWEIDEIPEWLTVTPASGNSDDKVTIVCGENATPDDRTATLIVNSGGIATTITVTQYGTIETNYIDMKFDDSDVEYSYNEQNGDLSVTYPAGDIPAVGEQSAIVLPAEYGYDIRVVESVEIDGNVVKMTTMQGNMADLFRDITFTLVTDPYSPTRAADGTRIITPVASGYIDSEGNYHEEYGTRAEYTYEKELWSCNLNFNGENIYNSSAGRVYWEKLAFNAELNGQLTFGFGKKIVQGKKLPIGDLNKFGYRVKGEVGADMKLHYNLKGAFSQEGDEIIKYNVLPTGVVRFLVGGVPVVILTYTHLGKQHSFEAEGNVDITAGVKFGNEMSIGLDWTPDDGVVQHKSITPIFDVYHPTLEAQASAMAKVSYYPQVEIGIYKFIGPWFEPRPYLKDEIEAGLRVSTDGKNHIGWKNELFSGLDLRMGLKLDFGMWDKEVWRSDVMNITDNLLFTSPNRITKLSPENGIKVEKGKSIKVEFLVESYCPVNKKYYPCPAALVNFEAECGELNTPVAIADINGKVSVEWTPQPTATRAAKEKESKLTASIVDKNGKAIDEETLTIAEGVCDNENHVHAVDLGLPSGLKWACCNVGATTPEEYGGYYAWGETEGKGDYDWDTYKYCNGSHNSMTKYCTSSSYGTVDNKTTLEPADDVATVKWGGSWRMPTTDEQQELKNNCTWTWTTLNGVNGYRVTGPNGNSIFLPAAGYRYGTEVYFRGSSGLYWSSSLDSSGSYGAYYLYFYDGSYDWDLYSYRYFDYTVRPVCP